MLSALYLRGNPAVSAIRSYRKTMIAALPTLSYLDDRPIFEVERLCAEAWCAGKMFRKRLSDLQGQMQQFEWIISPIIISIRSPFP